MRNVELSLESGADLDVRSFNVHEAMSAAFRVDVVARSHDDALDLGAVTGKTASLRVRGEHGDRAWTGLCARAAQSSVEPTGLSTYTFQLVPVLWLLTQRTGYRVFQHLSAPEIVEKVLGEWQIRPQLRLSQRHPNLALRTQYGESDYDFARRLLAEAGVSFFFHTDGGDPSHLVLSDAPETAEPLSGGAIRFAADSGMARGMPHVSDVDISSRVVATRATVRDHDFRRPRHAVTGTHAAEGSPHALLEDYRYAPGHSLAHASSAANEPMADSLGTYRHQDPLAAARATLHAEALRAGQTRIAFRTTRHDLAPGAIFSVEGHPHPEVAPGKKLLVTHSWLNGDVSATALHAGGRAVPADRPFRPAVDHGDDAGPAPDPFEPLQHTAKPRIHGVESAVVTGPRGEDVHTDEHGRVTVQFPWDREGKHDEKSPPWVRVSQAWAGPGYGVHTLPRVGHEVLVAFHGGDPDHPVVVGRVHDATGPVPYALPEHKMRTSIRTSTDAGSGGSANEITFDDATGQVLFYMQAAEDLHKIVHRDELELTNGNRSLHVDGDLTLSGGGTVTFVAGKDIVVKGGPNVFVNPKETPAPAKKPAPLTKAKKPPSKHGTPAKHAPAPAPHGGISAKGRAEMAALEKVAAGYAGGRRPLGWCLKKVEDYLQEVTYGKIGHGNIPRFEYAHDFADYLNAGDRYKSLGLQKLPITNPYDAPEGSIIVVRAGTPGTANPVAGDIVVKGPGDHFYNDGEMGYGGPANFPKGNNYVLGIYAPQ